MAEGPDVAAAQIEVQSAPMKAWKGPSLSVPWGLISDRDKMSETRRPYALMSLGVLGIVSWKRKPSVQAVRWDCPVSASFLLPVVRAEPMERNSADGLQRHSEKSRLMFTRATVFSLTADTAEFVILPSDAIFSIFRQMADGTSRLNRYVKQRDKLGAGLQKFLSVAEAE